MVLFSSLGPGPPPPPPPPPPDPPLAVDGIGPLPLAPDMGATFDAGIKLGLFVISLLQEREREKNLFSFMCIRNRIALTLSSLLVYYGLASLM